VPDVWTAFALLAIVLVVSALLSGVVERLPITFPMIFLGLGVVLSERGLGVLHVSVHDPGLEVVAILSLSFVLFLDAVQLRTDETGVRWIMPALSLGPGTIITMVLIALTGALLLGLPAVSALLLGAVLSSMDPVVLRDIVRDDRLPRSIRHALGVEAGANDIVVLPALLVFATIASGRLGNSGDWMRLLGQFFVLGPLAGGAVGLASVWLMKVARSHTSIARQYRALYGVGVILSAYVLGEAVGGSGFLAVFAAGAVVAATDHDICDCFLEYGEITSEMAMLLAFILFGALLSTLVTTIPLLPAIAFGVLVLVVARPFAISLLFARARVSRPARLFVGWFGPRGLSSLLFALLLVSMGVPDAELLLAIAGVVVILSVIAHGVSAGPVSTWYARTVARETLPEEREASPSGLFAWEQEEVPRITVEELAERLRGSDPPVVVDVRTRSSDDGPGIPGSVRVLPDHVSEWAVHQSHDRLLVTYCT
jgi:sodium/hydrogen antiporter